MNSIDVPFSADLIDQQALSVAGGVIHLPDGLSNPPVFRFKTLESYQEFTRLRTEMKKSALQQRS